MTDERLTPTRTALEEGRIGDAIDALGEVLAAAPTHGEAHLTAGQLAYAAGELDEAEALLLKASIFADNGALPLLTLAALALDRGDTLEARLYLGRCLSLTRESKIPAPWTLTERRPPPRLSPAVHTGRDPVVGVGLPVYSGGDMFAGVIEAVLAQTFGDLELIILDTGNDRLTRETVERYRAQDDRIRYVRTGEDIRYVGTKNNVRVMQSSTAPFYMWAAYDDRHHPTFVEKALARMAEAPDVGMVYSRTQLVSADGTPLGVADDDISTTNPDPVARYLHVIDTLSMCNAWYGLYRRSVLEQIRALFQHRLYRSYDNLFLAELALRSHIAQLPEVLFTRGLTRPRKKTYDEQNVDVIGSHHPEFLQEGLTLPMVRLIFAHIELLSRMPLDRAVRGVAAQRTIDILGARLGARVDAEIERAVALVGRGLRFVRWGGEGEAPADDMLERGRTVQVLQRLEEAALLRPGHAGLRGAINDCRAALRGPEPSSTPAAEGR